MSTAYAFDPPSADEQEIRDLITAWSRALERKDVAALTEHYAPDVMMYDVKPPYIVKGVEAYRKLWRDCLPYFPDGFTSEHLNLSVTVRGELAFMHALHHIVTKEAHPASQSWIRVTTCYQKRQGRWLVVHEHVSIPFDPVEERVAYITDAEVMAAPN